MKITIIRTNPDRVTRKVLVDTDQAKQAFKELHERIADINEVIDNKIDRTVCRICDLFG